MGLATLCRAPHAAFEWIGAWPGALATVAQHLTVRLEGLHVSENRSLAEHMARIGWLRTHDRCRVTDAVDDSWQCLRHRRNIILCLNQRIDAETAAMLEALPELRRRAAGQRP